MATTRIMVVAAIDLAEIDHVTLMTETAALMIHGNLRIKARLHAHLWLDSSGEHTERN
jgi:hypothetical protein